ncbi:MAG TPA: pitrilysin family protein, partial [Acidobacteriota bacterium]|nr:pitrilysin family protein [Acidobacteriota bacterium]
MKITRNLLIVWLACLTLAASAVAQERKIKVDYKETTLENGLHVITVEDHSAPVIAVSVTYNAGSRNEKKGRTGFAHLFEHMMFKGSENVGTGEHMVLVFNNGGTLNGTTNEDRTNYFEALPSNQLDLALFLEADRMRSLAITKENLDNQRNAVQEERRLSVDNRPYGKSEEIMQETLYDNFAYKHSVIGSMEDLNAATTDDVQQFFKIYYAPNNAVLSLV